MITKLTEGWQAITAAGTAILAIAAGTWGVAEYEANKAEQRERNSYEIEVVASAVQQLRTEADMNRWLYLRNLRKKVGLGPNQHKEYCFLGTKLFGDFKCPIYEGRKQRSD